MVRYEGLIKDGRILGILYLGRGRGGVKVVRGGGGNGEEGLRVRGGGGGGLGGSF